MDEKLVKVVCSDNEVEVPLAVMNMSVTFRNLGADLGDDDSPFPLPKVASATMLQISEFCKRHLGGTVPEENLEDGTQNPAYQEFKEAEVSPEDVAFIKALPGHPDLTSLNKFIEAVNFLDIKLALLTMLKFIGHSIRSLSPDGIRKFFLGEDSVPFTKEEEDQVKREHPWCDPALPPPTADAAPAADAAAAAAADA